MLTLTAYIISPSPNPRPITFTLTLTLALTLTLTLPLNLTQGTKTRSTTAAHARVRRAASAHVPRATHRRGGWRGHLEAGRPLAGLHPAVALLRTVLSEGLGG